MAKITSLAEITEVASDDLLVVVDKSDTSMADSGTDKKVKKSSLAKSLLDFFYPVGTIYETTSGNLDTVDKMNTHFGGTWEVYGSGRVLVAKSTDTEFDTIGETGGEKAHTLTIAEMPPHHHNMSPPDPSLPSGGNWEATGQWINATTSDLISYTDDTGGGQPHNNLQPYIVVYRYRRTA